MAERVPLHWLELKNATNMATKANAKKDASAKKAAASASKAKPKGKK